MISNETRSKVFAQYLGQKLTDNSTLSGVDIDGVTRDAYGTISYGEVKLILKPLSSISNEDAVLVAQILGYKYGSSIVIKSIKHSIRFGNWNDFKGIKNAFYLLTQFLQSKGYDLPQYLLDGKTLHEAGLCIYQQTPDNQ